VKPTAISTRRCRAQIRATCFKRQRARARDSEGGRAHCGGCSGRLLSSAARSDRSCPAADASGSRRTAALLTCWCSDRSTSRVGLVVVVWEGVRVASIPWKGMLLMLNVLFLLLLLLLLLFFSRGLSQVAREQKPSQVNAASTDHSHCHVGISPASNSCFLH